MRAGGSAQDKKAGQQQELQQKEGSQRGEPDPLQGTGQQSRQPQRRHEHWDRQHRRDRRAAAADEMRGKDDKVAGNVGGEQAAKSKKADSVYASSNNAEYGREQSRAERALGRRCRNPGRPEFSYLRHGP